MPLTFSTRSTDWRRTIFPIFKNSWQEDKRHTSFLRLLQGKKYNRQKLHIKIWRSPHRNYPSQKGEHMNDTHIVPRSANALFRAPRMRKKIFDRILVTKRNRHTNNEQWIMQKPLWEKQRLLPPLRPNQQCLLPFAQQAICREHLFATAESLYRLGKAICSSQSST